MAKKFTFNNFPAYQEGYFAVLKRDDIDGLWRVYHIPTSQRVMGTITPFKQKRDALALAEAYCNTTVNWEFGTAEEMYQVNSSAVIHDQIKPILAERV